MNSPANMQNTSLRSGNGEASSSFITELINLLSHNSLTNFFKLIYMLENEHQNTILYRKYAIFESKPVLQRDLFL